ncbi:MAG: HD domain-containing protein [Candidatus Merdivicinus sp.]
MQLTFDEIRHNDEVNTYIRQADASLDAMGFTEHSFAHVGRCAHQAAVILETLGYPERTVELVRIAGYLHDIGNVVNRVDHAQSGAIMAFRILDKLGMPPEEVAAVITAIGNHDEDTACPVNELAAALILADKSDVRRTRVRSKETIAFDIHDRVNYAVEKSELSIDRAQGVLTLNLTIDSSICPILEYFEIFMNRMLLCRKAAAYFQLRFGIIINGQVMM